MKNNIGIKLCSVIGAAYSIMTLMEGLSVVFGSSIKEYHVVPALLYYNIVFGFVGLTVSIGLWFNQTWSIRLASIIAVFHAAVLLLTASFHFYSAGVAIESVKAMTIRASVWVIMSIVMRKSIISVWRKKVNQHSSVKVM